MRRISAVLVAGVVTACAGDEQGDASGSLEVTEARPLTAADVAECGDSLEDLGDESFDGPPSALASYGEALADWPYPGTCQVAGFRGECADGKQFLYRNGGFSSQVRYFRDGELVGMVASGDVGYCPSPCPFSRFYGALDSVRCEASLIEPLCAGWDWVLDERGQLNLPFADGRTPYGCS